MFPATPSPSLSPTTFTRIRCYWADEFGINPGDLFRTPFSGVTHGTGFKGYPGVQALFDPATGHAVVSIPPDALATVGPLLEPFDSPCSPSHPCDASSLARALHPVTSRAIGPAILHYADASVPLGDSNSTARVIHLEEAADSALVDSLQSSVAPLEWEHGGSDRETSRLLCGVITGQALAALASYEIWGGVIAHISIVTHPAYRGLAHGQAAVAFAARHALEHNLVPQYRTLASNLPSLSLGRKLGFVHVLTSLAVRMTSRAPGPSPDP